MSPRRQARSLLAQEIVGRDGILLRLEEALDASATESEVIALVGDAGLGKTRLLRVLVANGREQGRLVLVGRASPLEAALPLGVLIDVLRSERRSQRDAPVPEDALAASLPSLLLPELRTGESAPSTDRGVLFEAAARYVRARADPHGLVLALEDLHWADPTSHALIGYLARTTRDAPILLALTFRPVEEPPRPSLDELRQELARERLGQELALSPLGEEDVALMLRDILGVDPPPEALRLVARRSGGNPFVIEELVRDAVDAGRLDPEDGSWEIAEPVELPRTVQEMVLRRVRALSGADQELLRWAAILGERFDPALLATLADLSEQATNVALGRLREAGLVAERGDGRMGFRHALTREGVLGGLLEPERRRRHARVLEFAEALPDGVPGLPLEELLEHALGAGDRVKSLAYSIQAADRSVNLGGYQEARAQYERALVLWEPADGPEMRARLFMRLGYLTSIGGGRIACVIEPRSREQFVEARRLYEEIGDTSSAALATAGVVWSGPAFDVLDDLRQARAQLGPDARPEAVCQILGCLAEREFLVGYPRSALRTSAEGLALLAAQTGESDPSYVPTAGQLRRSFRLTSALADWWLGDDAGGRATMIAVADEALGRHDYFEAVLAYQTLSRAGIDRPAEALRYAQLASDLAGAEEMPAMHAWLAHLRAQALLHLGEWEAADELVDRAEALIADMPDQPYLRHALGMVRAELALVRGRPAGTVEIFEPLIPEFDPIAGRIFSRVFRGTLARARLADGDLARARAALGPLFERWDPGEEGPFALSALLPIVAVEVAGAGGDAAEAGRWAAELEDLGSGARAAYARALAELAAGSAPDEGAIEAAASIVEADGRHWEGAWMRIMGADAARRAGDPEQAGELAAAALERVRAMGAEDWCRRLEALLRQLGRRVPSRRSGHGSGGLTKRELEVMRLVAEGSSNQEIATRLFISKATVIRHVANIFAKLGVRNRAEATRVAGERGLLETPERS